MHWCWGLYTSPFSNIGRTQIGVFGVLSVTYGHRYCHRFTEHSQLHLPLFCVRDIASYWSTITLLPSHAYLAAMTQWNFTKDIDVRELESTGYSHVPLVSNNAFCISVEYGLWQAHSRPLHIALCICVAWGSCGKNLTVFLFLLSLTLYVSDL